MLVVSVRALLLHYSSIAFCTSIMQHKLRELIQQYIDTLYQGMLFFSFWFGMSECEKIVWKAILHILSLIMELKWQREMLWNLSFYKHLRWLHISFPSEEYREDNWSPWFPSEAKLAEELRNSHSRSHSSSKILSSAWWAGGIPVFCGMSQWVDGKAPEGACDRSGYLRAPQGGTWGHTLIPKIPF